METLLASLVVQGPGRHSWYFDTVPVPSAVRVGDSLTFNYGTLDTMGQKQGYTEVDGFERVVNVMGDAGIEIKNITWYERTPGEWYLYLTAHLN